MANNLIAGLKVMFGKATVAPVEEKKFVTEAQLNDIKKEQNTIINSKRYQEDIDDITAKFIAFGYKAMREILPVYEEGSLMEFCKRQEVLLGSYDKEKDTLEQLTKAQLIERILDNNKLQFRQRMVEQGKAFAPKQSKLDFIQDLAEKYNEKIDFSKIKTTFDAQDIIEFIYKKHNIQRQDPKGQPNENQIQAVKNLCKRLNMEVAASMVDTAEDASKTIRELSAQVEEQVKNEEPVACSEKQVTYASNLWTKLGHKVTAKKKAEFTAMSKREMSALIKDLEKEYEEKDPEANAPSEKQLSYICTLLDMCMMPKPDIMPKTKKAATASIANLKRHHLFILTRVTSPSLTKDDIRAMSTEAVDNMRDAIMAEKKTRDYTFDYDTENEIKF